MAIELVTGYQGKDHVTADQWADFNRGIFGKDTILPVGNRMETAIQTANQITVKDGVAVIDGRQVYIGYGESENIVIQSGTQGMLRRDIVVLEYNRDESGIESVAFKVITGEPKASDAVDPSVENTDIRTGVSSSQKPFCRVRLNGTAIEGVDVLIPVREFQPHAFEDTVKDFTTTETGHVPDATLTKKLKDEVTKLNGDYKVKNITVTNLHPKIANKDEAFRAKQRSGIVEIESIMKLPAGTYSNSDTLGTIKPAPLHTVRMNCVTKEDSIFTVNIYAGTGSIKFNSTQIETTRDLFFIGQAAYIAEA